jgi:hypothetical protein
VIFNRKSVGYVSTGAHKGDQLKVGWGGQPALIDYVQASEKALVKLVSKLIS